MGQEDGSGKKRRKRVRKSGQHEPEVEAGVEAGGESHTSPPPNEGKQRKRKKDTPKDDSPPSKEPRVEAPVAKRHSKGDQAAPVAKRHKAAPGSNHTDHKAAHSSSKKRQRESKAEAVVLSPSKAHTKGEGESEGESEGGQEAATELSSKPCFFTSKAVYQVRLHPSGLVDSRLAVTTALNKHVMQYSEALRGVLVAYTDVELVDSDGVALMKDDLPYLFFRVSLSALVFRPPLGEVMEGVVNRVSSDHISALCFGTFNASIATKSLTAKGFTYQPAKGCFSAPHADVAIGRSVWFRCVGFHVGGGVVTLTSRFEKCCAMEVLIASPPLTALRHRTSPAPLGLENGASGDEEPNTNNAQEEEDEGEDEAKSSGDEGESDGEESSGNDKGSEESDEQSSSQ